METSVRPDRQAMASAAVFLAFEPSSAFVQRVIRWLTDFCQLSLADLELCARLRLAVSELVENVVKYGMQPNVSVEVALLERDGQAILRLGTRNRASADYLARATELLTALRSAADPIEYYDRLVRESAPRVGVSGLGLARIRAEGELELDSRWRATSCGFGSRHPSTDRGQRTGPMTDYRVTR